MSAFLRILIVPLCAFAASTAQVAPIGWSAKEDAPGKEPEIYAATRDGGGGVWAASPLGMLFYEGGGWSKAEIPRTSLHDEPRLAVAHDGDVLALWRDGEQMLITRHRAARSRVWCRVNASYGQWRLLPLKNGGALLTERGRRVIRIQPDGKNQEHFEIPESAFHAPKLNDDGSISGSHALILALENEAGTAWLWSYTPYPVDFEWRLRCLVRLKDAGFATMIPPEWSEEWRLGAVHGLPGGKLLLFPSGQPPVVWDGKSESVTVPAYSAESSLYGEWVMRTPHRGLAITTPRPTETKVSVSKVARGFLQMSTHKHFDPAVSTSFLQELDDQGNLVATLTSKLDKEPAFDWMDRPWCLAPGGVVIGLNGNGLAFLPDNGGDKDAQPLVTRRLAESFSRPEILVELDAEHFLVAGRKPGMAWRVPYSVFSAPEAVDERYSRLSTGTMMIEDDQQRVWAHLPGEGICRWERGQWEKVEVAKTFALGIPSLWLRDNLNRGWLLASGRMAVVDFSTGQWTYHGSFKDALRARATPGLGFQQRELAFSQPVIWEGEPLKAAMIFPSGSIWLLDNGEVRNWYPDGVAGPDGRLTGRVGFSKEGRLRVSINHKLWQWEPPKWVNLGDAGNWPALHMNRERAAPPNCGIENISSTVQDSAGVTWVLTGSGSLWRAIPGAEVELRHDAGGSVLKNSEGLYEALLAADGTCFLRTKWAAAEYLVVKPARARLSKPRTSQMKIEGNDASLNVVLSENDWLTWRLDDGETAPATRTPRVRLNHLEVGRHKLRVWVYDDHLIPCKEPAVLEFEIHAAPEDELKSLLHSLTGSLAEREAAARRLRLQGRAILPVLREARAKADESSRWWLDAVIQHLESARPWWSALQGRRMPPRFVSQ